MVYNFYEKIKKSTYFEITDLGAFVILSTGKISAMAAEWFFLNVNYNALWVLWYKIVLVYIYIYVC